MRNSFVAIAIVGLAGFSSLLASPAIMKEHCMTCHNDEKAKGKFRLGDLGKSPSSDSLQRWLDALDLVASKEMPPEDESELSDAYRQELITYLKNQLSAFKNSASSKRTPSRRLNNREFANSIRDVLLLEDIGTHQPTDNLIGDSLHEGFDTHGETLGFSMFHLEQYIEAVRKIVDATVLSGPRPESHHYEIDSMGMLAEHTSQNIKRPERRGRAEGFDFLDPKQLLYFEDFKTVPHTGRYKITLRATGKDRGIYSAEDTGVYHDDPILMTAQMGDRQRTFELPDEEITEITLDEWLAAGTRFRLHYPTDGLKMRGNGNFKFQYAIGGQHLKRYEPGRWKQVVAAITTKPGRRQRRPESWHHWTEQWQGARPRVYSAVVEGPYFMTWPSKRQLALLGENPSVGDAEKILRPLAERAWRRAVRQGELDQIVTLVNETAKTKNEIDALKEGIIALLVSPPFLLHNLEALAPKDRFAAKFSYFLDSTIPDAAIRESANTGTLDSYQGVKKEIQSRLSSGSAEAFLREFPFGWLKLNDINFMAPDPDQYRFYHRKNMSDDMIDEVLQFFRHIVENNRPVTEFISADYSFVNADLAQIYDLTDVPQDSKLRKYTFTNGRRGGLLGMSAFLTVTADSLGTSPIHRAIYVMENFLGIHPSPPPPDVEIKEPDVRQARTIKEVLNAHQSDPNCAFCHESIDPYGYAFENFNPTGSWRDSYTVPAPPPADTEAEQVAAKNRKPNDIKILIDASATFRNGSEYRDILGYRKQFMSPANRDRFVRCFISKLLTYANGKEPEPSDFTEIDRILAVSAKHGYRIVETLAAVIHSPIFREE